MIVHCPTNLMISDFFTKPLQGALFRKFKDVIMGIIDIFLLHQQGSDPAKEHIEDCENSHTSKNTFAKFMIPKKSVLTSEQYAAVRTVESRRN